METDNLQTPKAMEKFPPKYPIIFRDISIAYMVVAFLIGSNLIINDTNIGSHCRILFMFISGILNAFVFHYLFLFVHEAGHFNIYPNKKINDFFGNILLSYWFFQEIKLYRMKHWEHHQKHGERDDPESSYFNPLSLKNLVLAVSGIFAFKKAKFVLESQKGENVFGEKSNKGKAFLFFLVYQILILFLFLYDGAYLEYMLVWFSPFFFGFPFLSFIRQVCEHRRYGVGSTEFGLIEHGVHTRVFKKDFFSQVFGGAGFRQHWYHHFNPYISYTRLDEFSEEVKKKRPHITTEVNEETYLKTVQKLIAEARN